ncbi:roadblock/LC7 domain-containing protein [Stenotrophomonas sp. ATCM1_4]|uniref:Roadblock/LC7 domain-containing protein n=1 Tax=Stenotrophomonas capsici TaxID=3110230 RepID=A0ABU5V0V2_9GAMM|nr:MULTISPECIES: roadblock/LC7 domain-containing protein [unclassified Stenotrophomonas]MEA5666971.1 roadblock/LC7 domain-containing protein [Stenotrophomonas sp. MH1]TDB28562.1 roadblock/LC7 domain-containing protein [Stenotrophomonas sp. ATCM1_4]
MSDVGSPSVTVDGPALEAALDSVMEGSAGISMLLVSTADGRAIAHRSRNKLDPRRLSAMSNSFLTLGETLSRELGLATADYVTMSTAQGSMVLVRVDADRPYTLAALGHSDTSLAILLYAARDAAARIKALL